MTEPSDFMTVDEWRERDNGDLATPLCPHCQNHLGIRLSFFTSGGRDVWLCDKCGEFGRA